MTTRAVGNAPRTDHATALVATNAEEQQTLLRRAILIRHGETEWTLSGQHTGITDIPLTEKGRAAARLLAPLGANMTFARVLTSPLHRARETCELAGLGGQARVEPDLLEWNYGEYEGLTPQKIHARNPNWMLFAHGHLFRVFAARWLGLPPAAGCHFLLDPGTLSVLSHYRGIPALKVWNAPLTFEP